MHQPREPCEMYPYFSPKLCNLPCELLYLRLKTAPDDGLDSYTNRPKDVDFQKMKKRCEKLSFRAKIEKWEQRYGGKQLRRMNKEAQNVKHLKIAVEIGSPGSRRRACPRAPRTSPLPCSTPALRCSSRRTARPGEPGFSLSTAERAR